MKTKEGYLTSPPKKKERALLVGLLRAGEDLWSQEESLNELGELVQSAGGEVADTAIQKRESPSAATYIGSGKARELNTLCSQCGAKSIIFDDELSPAQSRNLEQIFKRKVLDRTQLILDIFAQRARTREGKLQIELAQLQYLLPRLTGMWRHLSRQGGGIGTRGPGETQLEVDRRRVKERIERLGRELVTVRQSRGVQRAARQRHHWPVAAVVGYTNAGKSTLLNKLTMSNVFAADQLFATLDPTTRQFLLPNKQKVLLTDTVGFLQKLPHDLVESFKATLEEVSEADLLLHVVDLSHPQFENQIEAVNQVLELLNALNKQTILVFNKIDRVPNAALIEHTTLKHPNSVAISAKNGLGMDDLLAEIENQLRAWRLRVRLVVPNHETALLASLHESGRILEMRYENDIVHLVAHIPPQLRGLVRRYVVEESDDPATPEDIAWSESARKFNHCR